MAIFSAFTGYFFRDYASIIIQHWLSNDPKIICDLEWLLHAKFCFHACRSRTSLPLKAIAPPCSQFLAWKICLCLLVTYIGYGVTPAINISTFSQVNCDSLNAVSAASLQLLTTSSLSLNFTLPMVVNYHVISWPNCDLQYQSVKRYYTVPFAVSPLGVHSCRDSRYERIFLARILYRFGFLRFMGLLWFGFCCFFLCQVQFGCFIPICHNSLLSYYR